jgi:hypothetical protein
MLLAFDPIVDPIRLIAWRMICVAAARNARPVGFHISARALSRRQARTTEQFIAVSRRNSLILLQSKQHP